MCPLRQAQSSTPSTSGGLLERVAEEGTLTRRSTVSSLVRMAKRAKSRAPGKPRSEEHTSELQSRLHLVCRLLLEKKKKRNALEMTHMWNWHRKKSRYGNNA